MNSPLVSVFIPVYNCQDYIKDSLESIINQTYHNLEIILVDDGSTDDSVKIIQSISDERIRLIQNNENMGIPYTRNVGIKEAKGKYLVIMDSDDISSLDRVEKQVDFLESNPDIDAVGSYYIKFGGRFDRKIKTQFTQPEEIKILLLFFNPIANPSAAMRMKTIIENNLEYNLNYFVAQDYGMWAQLSKVGNISIIPEYLLRYRSGHENITKKSKKEKTEKRIRIINSIHNDLLEHYHFSLNDEELNVFNEFFSYNYGTIKNTDLLVKVINKLIQWNQVNGTFDHKLFIKVLEHSTIVGLSNQQISLKHKLQLYKKLVSIRGFKEILFISIKHLVYKIKG